jgi:hypothetical protein
MFVANSSYAVSYGRWQVNRQESGGTNWSLVDTFFLTSTQGAAAVGFAADDQENIFVSGPAADAGGRDHWIVRKSGDNGQTWITVDDYPNASAGKMRFIPGTNGGLFVVGYRSNSIWTVRRSRDSGASWTVVDSLPGFAYGVSSDSAGNVYVVGESGVRWTVRQSSNGGNTWQTIYSSSSNTGFGAYDIAADNLGNLWVTGSYDLGWGVLRRDPAGVWQPMEFLGPTSSDINGLLSIGPEMSSSPVRSEMTLLCLSVGYCSGVSATHRA